MIRKNISIEAAFPVSSRLCRNSLLIMLLAVMCGCGDSPPESRLKAVGEDLERSTSELEELDARVETAENELENLREQRRELRGEVLTLEERLEARATDVALFRAVQSALLNEEMLQESAVAVGVEDGEVTLSGIVRSEDELQRAVNIAREVAGVDRVRSTIRVEAGPANSRR